MTKIVIIGAGQAGYTLASKLRESGFSGSITLLGREGVAPYERPPLSKAFLIGEAELSDLLLRPENYYAENEIALKTNDEAVHINRPEKHVQTTTRAYPYDQLILATGSVPRKLPANIGGTLDGIFTLRDFHDVERLTPYFSSGRRLLIVGGGYIGLEAAAVASNRGLQVTVLEMAPRILQRVASPKTSDYFRDLHKRNGVDIREGVGLSQLTGDTHVSGAVLSDGSKIEVDFVIAGIGITPETHLAEQAGLDLDNGIAVNAFGQTSDPSIWAVGDCASYPTPEGRQRLECVSNAIDMAELVAGNIMGAEKKYSPAPWFWSEQYDVTLQIAGYNSGYTDVVERCEGDARSFWYYLNETLISVDAMNDPKAFMIAKRLIKSGKSPSPKNISNTNLNLKTFLKG